MKDKPARKSALFWSLVTIGTLLVLLVVYWIGTFVYCGLNPITCMESAGRKYLEKQGFMEHELTHGRETIGYYDSGGTGKTMIFLHGRIFSSTQFARHAFLKPFADSGYRLVLVDLPGHGLSTRAGKGLSLGKLDSAITAFIREWKYKPVVLLGYGLGGWIACRVATKNPGWFSKIVLIEPEGLKKPGRDDPPLLPDTRKQWRNALEKAEPGTNKLKGLDYFVDDMIQRAAKIGIEKLYSSLQDDDFIMKGRIFPKVPTVVVYGSENLLNPPSRGKLFSEKLEKAVFRVVNKAGGAPFLKKPAGTAAVILDGMAALDKKKSNAEKEK
ncbi:MAG: alpha/beta hydrolase [Deltaproteobacteria bacterium]|nr:alpha/beta hydrolase [Deltaproteobacteria bacterium]